MKTRALKILVLVFLAQIVLYACCGDEFNVDLQSFEFVAEDLGDGDTSSVTNADFNLQVTPFYRYQLVSFLSIHSSLIPTAYATSCLDDYTFINRVETITLTADVPLFDIPAGSSLNNRVLVEYQYDEDIVYEMNDLLLQLNNDLSDLNYNLTFDTAIPAETTATFTLTITFENEEQLVRVASPVTFTE